MTPEQQGFPDRRYAWIVVVILMLTTIISYTDRQVLSLLVDPIRAEFNATDRQLSYLIGGAFAIAYGLAGLPMGYFADRLSRRNMIVCGIVVWSIATICCALARSYSELFAARLAVGIGEAVLSPAALSLIADYFPPHRRGAAIGCYFTGISLSYGGAMVVGGLILGAINGVTLFPGTPFEHLSAWRIVLLMIGVPSLLWVLPVLLIKEPARQLAAGTVSESGGADIPAFRLWAMTIPLYFAIASASMIDNAVGAWSPSMLIREYGMPAAQVGTALGLPLMIGFGGGQLIGGFLADHVGKRWGRRGQLFVSLGLALLIFPVAQAARQGSVAWVLTGIATYFFLAGNIISILFSMMVNAMPPRRRALAISLAFLLNVALGASAGPVIVTFAAESMKNEGLAGAITFTTGLGALVMSGCILLMILLLGISGRRSREAPQVPA